MVPIYLTEQSPPYLKGMTGSMNSSFICFGFIIAYSTGYGLLDENIDQKIYYKLILALPVVTCTMRSIFLKTIFTIDTPNFYLKRGFFQEANLSLQAMFNK